MRPCIPVEGPDKTRPGLKPTRLWRRLPWIGGLLLLGVLLAACQLPGEDEEVWGTALEPDAGAIRGLTPEHLRSHPTTMTTDAEQRRAYITMGGTIARPDNQIAVVDLETGDLLDPITVGVRPLDVQVDPQDPQRIFVAHPYSPSLTVIDSERNAVVQILDAPYYIERIQFTSNGQQLLAADRAGDRLIVFNVERDELGYTLDEQHRIPTGPNPQEIEIIAPAPGMPWQDDRLVTVSDRHGASVTLIDLQTQDTRRIDVGGPPMGLASRDGLLFVAGVGPGNGTGQESGQEAAQENGQGNGLPPETGTAALENSLLVLDLRQGPETIGRDDAPGSIRYQSDTARGDDTPSERRILGGALPRNLQWDEQPLPRVALQNTTELLWVTYHSSDQVQALEYHSPDPNGPLPDDLLRTPSNTHGVRLNPLPGGEPLGPGRLTDTTHAVYETPPGPRDTLRRGDLLFTLAELPEQLHVTDLRDCPGAGDPGAPCTTRKIDLVAEPVVYPTGPFERGERLFVSAFPSADQDRSAIMCHPDGLSTGQTFALPHRDLEPVKIPRLDDVADNTPWLLDGSAHRPQDYLDAAAGDLLLPDGDDPHNLAQAALENETDETNDPGTSPSNDAGSEDDDGTDNTFPPPQDNTTARERFPGATMRLQMVDPDLDDPADWMRLTFAFLVGERRVPPPPPYLSSPDGRDMEEGRALFDNPMATCASCHIGGGSTAVVLTQEQSEEVPRPPNADRIKAPPMNGLWDREASGLLHDGRADSIPAALLPEGHQCLGPAVTGLEGPWHGDVLDRTCSSIDNLAAYLRALEARR